MTNEKECITEILNGNHEKYRELVERYQTGLIIHCENILKNRHDAEDIAQDAFITAFRKLSEYTNDKGRFSTWIYRIATNKCIDLLRKNKRKIDIEHIEEQADRIDPAQFFEDEIVELRGAIEALEPPKYADVIKAYFWEGKSYQEIALSHETSTSTIGTWIRRAKLQLKEKLS